MKPSEVVEEWRENNEGFRYEPPEKGPEYWSQDEYNELYDRVIQRNVEWVCDECSTPFNSLERARRHVADQHGDRLLDQAERRMEEGQA